MTKKDHHVFASCSGSPAWNYGYRLAVTVRGGRAKSADMRLRFTTWQGASDYLESIIHAGIVLGGRIDQHVDGIGWVLADTNPEDER